MRKSMLARQASLTLLSVGNLNPIAAGLRVTDANSRELFPWANAQLA